MKFDDIENNLDVKTIQLSDYVYFETGSNMIVLAMDRVTVTLTLSEYLDLYTSMKDSTSAITQFVAITAGINRMSEPINNDDIKSGSFDKTTGIA